LRAAFWKSSLGQINAVNFLSANLHFLLAILLVLDLQPHFMSFGSFQSHLGSHCTFPVIEMDLNAAVVVGRWWGVDLILWMSRGLSMWKCLHFGQLLLQGVAKVRSVTSEGYFERFRNAFRFCKTFRNGFRKFQNGFRMFMNEISSSETFPTGFVVTLDKI
jgi:hypothetical protein